MQLNVHGVKLYFEEYGNHGPNVLFLHGWGCSVLHFEKIMQSMCENYRVFAIDFPAHGKTNPPPAPWGVSDFCECVRGFITEKELAPCNIVAHSFGGRVALMLAAKYPDLVHKLILTGCAGLKKEKTAEQIQKEAAYQKKKDMLLRIEKIKLFSGLTQKMRTDLQKRYGSADYNALSDEMKKTFVKVISEDLRPLLPHIQAPTLLVWGENDTETSLWMGKIMESEIPDAALVVFEQDDHFAYLRQWPRFVKIADAFFTEG